MSDVFKNNNIIINNNNNNNNNINNNNINNNNNNNQLYSQLKKNDLHKRNRDNIDIKNSKFYKITNSMMQRCLNHTNKLY